MEVTNDDCEMCIEQVSKSLDFFPVSESFVWRGGEIHKVPVTSKEMMKSSALQISLGGHFLLFSSSLLFPQNSSAVLARKKISRTYLNLSKHTKSFEFCFFNSFVFRFPMIC